MLADYAPQLTSSPGRTLRAHHHRSSADNAHKKQRRTRTRHIAPTLQRVVQPHEGALHIPLVRQHDMLLTTFAAVLRFRLRLTITTTMATVRPAAAQDMIMQRDLELQSSPPDLSHES